MGLSSGFNDVSAAAPLPLLLASVASALASLSSSSSSSSSSSFPDAGRADAAASVRFSGLASLVALADYLAASRVSTASATATAGGDCTVCLSAITEGDRVRTLACRHAFHAACLDGWFNRSSISSPLCRDGPAEQDEAEARRAGADAIAWFARF